MKSGSHEKEGVTGVPPVCEGDESAQAVFVFANQASAHTGETPVPLSLAHATLNTLLQSALANGFHRIGQIVISASGENYHLRHEDDSDATDLEIFSSPDDAVEIVRWDSQGNYRPLKTAPNLRRGWELKLSSLAHLHLALDTLYPAALGNWRAVLLGEKISPPLRETLNRQTGMYRITGLLTRDEATRITSSLCAPGCLRQILWPLESSDANPKPLEPEGRIPLFCTNICSLFLGEARAAVKARPPAS
jgi:sirohydrochlorin cobaltochelatase